MISMMKPIKISLFLGLLASGASCATRPPQAASESEVDRRIEFAVTQQLANDPKIYARHIDVSVYRGVVTLSGFVTESSELFEATRVAARVPGVASVEDQMELQMFGRGGGSSGQ